MSWENPRPMSNTVTISPCPPSRSLSPLVAAGILLGGNGLQGTLMALRGAQKDFRRRSSVSWARLFWRLPVLAARHQPDHEGRSGAACALGAGGDRLRRHADCWCWSSIRDVVGDPLPDRLLLRRPLHSHAKLAEFRRLNTTSAGYSHSTASSTSARSTAPSSSSRCSARRTIFAIMSMMITLSLGAGVAQRPLQPARPDDVKLDLPKAWRISPSGPIGWGRRRRHQQRLPDALAGLCRADRPVGHRRGHLRQRRHHRRRHHPVSARLPSTAGTAQGAVDLHHRRAGRRAGSSFSTARWRISCSSSSSAPSPCRCSRCRPRMPTTAPRRANSCWSTRR